MDPSIKKIINNSGFIAELAPIIDGSVARDLAKAANAYRNILKSLNIKVSTEGFDGCEQAKLLVKWWRDDNPDYDLMRKWTTDIQSAIDDLAHGKLPRA